MKDPIAKVTITCAVIGRNLEGAAANIAGCDKAAVAVFGHRSLEIGMADLIEIAVIFDGLHTTYEISLSTLSPEDFASVGGKRVN